MKLLNFNESNKTKVICQLPMKNAEIIIISVSASCFACSCRQAFFRIARQSSGSMVQSHPGPPPEPLPRRGRSGNGACSVCSRPWHASTVHAVRFKGLHRRTTSRIARQAESVKAGLHSLLGVSSTWHSKVQSLLFGCKSPGCKTREEE